VRRIATMVLVALAAGAGGCEKAVVLRRGVAFRGPDWQAAAGSYAPTVPIRDGSGRVSTIDGSAGPIYVAAFVPPPAGDPLGPDPDVVELAGYLNSSYYTDLVQITVPTKNRPLDPNARPAPSKLPYLMHLVLDPRRVAWDAFRHPPLGTILLVDDHGHIAGHGTVDKPDWLMFRADRMGWEYEREHDLGVDTFDSD